MEIQINISRARKVGKLLVNVYRKDGVFGYRKGNMPELLKPKGFVKGSIQHINYLTLLVALDYMRDANQLWKAGVNAFSDRETKWIFDVNSKKLENLNRLIEALRKHKVSKKHKRDAEFWQKIALGIRNEFNGNMKRFVEKECNNNAKLIFALMKSSYRRSFPSLTGDKILPLWIRIMEQAGGLKIKDLNEIPLPVDVHIARATIFTGCLKGSNIRTSIPKIMLQVDKVWTIAAEQYQEFGKFDLNEPLWTLSKYGCGKLRDKICPAFNKCPIKNFCEATKKEMKVVQGNKGIIIE